tara:strand:+ start:142 stop:552 length:411 start_codon:yes stop_codon:yes gene_type:complete
MANKITASITFYFKGEIFTPSLELDLDLLMQRYNGLPPLHETLAVENNIDSYSYQYEMLLGEDIQFSHAEGDAVTFLNDGEFDQAAYEHFWFQKNILNHLQKIIHTELDIDEIELHPKLIQAMLAAFQYGRDYTRE